MSKLGCPCGHTISDTTDCLPFKAYCLPDLHLNSLFEWIASQAQSYVDAAKAGKTSEWLLSRGVAQDYANLRLADGEILHDFINGKFSQLTRDVYECENCGRVHIESGTANHFVSYSPDGRRVHAIFNSSEPDRPRSTES